MKNSAINFARKTAIHKKKTIETFKNSERIEENEYWKTDFHLSIYPYIPKNGFVRLRSYCQKG